MFKILAIKFAAWLAPKFEVWVFQKIEEILKNEYNAFHTAPQPLLPKKITYIYFLKSVQLNRVKIGMSDNLQSRWNTLKTMTADELELIKIVRVSALYPNDTAIHKLFSHLRLHGEWFTFDRELEDFIDQLPTQSTYAAPTFLSYQMKIRDLEAQIIAQKKRLFKNKHLIEQLTQELSLLQKQYAQSQKPQVSLQDFSFNVQNLDTIASSNNAIVTPIYNSENSSKTFFLYYNHQYHQVSIQDITYIEKQGQRVVFITKDGEQYPTKFTLKELSQLLPPNRFVLVSRTHIVHLQHLTSINTSKKTVTVCKDIELHTSKNQLQNLLAQIRVLKGKK